MQSKGLNIDTIKRLTGRIPLDSEDDSQNRSCIEFSVRGTPQNVNLIHEKFVTLSGALDIDISFPKDNIYRRNRRLICFDMDSTLIKTEVIDELAERAGAGEEVRAITEAAMRGEIDFSESFKNVFLFRRFRRICIARNCRKSSDYGWCRPTDAYFKEMRL